MVIWRASWQVVIGIDIHTVYKRVVEAKESKNEARRASIQRSVSQ
jgi:hypothetical protein